MSKTMKDLAKEFVKLDEWFWMSGMADQHDDRIVSVSKDGLWYERGLVLHSEGKGLYPNLKDPATRGCILHMVREKIGNFGVSTFYHFDIKSGLMCWQVRNPIDVYGFAHRFINIREGLDESKEASNIIEMEALLDTLKGGPNLKAVHEVNLWTHLLDTEMKEKS